MQHIDHNVYYYYLDELEKCGHISEFEKQAIFAHLGRKAAVKFPNFTQAMTDIGVNAGQMSPGMAIGNAAVSSVLPSARKGVTNLANRIGRTKTSISKNPAEIAANAARNKRRTAAGNALHFTSDRIMPIAGAVF